MNAYIYHADMLCEHCGVHHINLLTAAKIEDNGDSDTFPQGPYSNGGGESDCPQHCNRCGTFLENPLTSEGLAYVKDRLSIKGGNRAIRKLWTEFYGID